MSAEFCPLLIVRLHKKRFDARFVASCRQVQDLLFLICPDSPSFRSYDGSEYSGNRRKVKVMTENKANSCFFIRSDLF